MGQDITQMGAYAGPMTGTTKLLVSDDDTLQRATASQLLELVPPAPPAPTPDIGEIRYFSTAPTGLGWMACDGAAYLRTAYPAIAALMPNPAWKFEELAPPNGAALGNQWGNYFQFWTGTSWLITGSGRYTYRSTDQGSSWAVMPLLSGTEYFQFYKLGSGRIVAVGCYYTGVAHSDDDGVTWSAITAAIPAPPAGYFRDMRSGVVFSGRLYIPRPASDKLDWTADGVTWNVYTLPLVANWTLSVPVEGLSNIALFASDRQASVRVGINGSGTPTFSTDAAFLGVLPYTARPFMAVTLTNGDRIIAAQAAHAALKQDHVYGGFIATPIIEGGVSAEEMIIIGSGVLILSYGSSASTVQCAWMFNGDTSWSVGPIGPDSPIGWIAPWSGSVCAASGAAEALLTLEARDWSGVGPLFRITLDPLKFNAPGIPDKAGASPYVFTGA